MASMVLFFCNDPVLKVASFLFDEAGHWLSIAVASLAVYLPAFAAFVNHAKRQEVFSGLSFICVYSALVLLFLITLCLHPEYASKMFQEGWNYNVLLSVFNPLCAVFAYLVICYVRKPNLIKKSLELAAYLNFLYCLVRFANASIRGYWDAYVQTGAMIHSSYSLGFGYSMLFSVLVFFALVFKHRNTRLNLVLALIGLTTIFLGGNRASLVFAVIGAFVFFVYYGGDLRKKSPWVVLLYIASMVFFAAAVILFDQIISWLSQTLSSLGLSSRSLEAIVEGSFADGNGRDQIYEMASDLIGQGATFGYGFYGDRYTIGQSYYWGYPHNVILELQITFGAVPGIVIAVLIGLFVLHALFAGKREYRELALLFTLLCLQLFVSNSYLYCSYFWSLIAIGHLQVVETGMLGGRRLRSLSGAQRTWFDADS